MTLKAPLKISAVGLSLLAIAVSSCNKGATNTSGNSNPPELDPKNNSASNKIQNLSIKLGQEKIPAGTCTDYQVIATNEAGATEDITNNHFVVVSLNEKSSIKQFTLDKIKHLICAYQNIDTDKRNTVEGSQASVVASTPTYLASAKVEAAAPIKLTEIKTEGNISGAVGTKTQEFEIKAQQTLNGDFKALTSSEGFELVDANGSIIELKSKTASKFYFEIPKNTLVGKNAYTLRYTTQPNINTQIEVKVDAAVLTSVALKDTLGNTIPSVLTTGAQLAFTLEGIFSDDSRENLSDTNNGYTITPNLKEIDYENNLIILTVPREDSEKFAPKVLSFFVAKNDIVNNYFTVQYYIDNKPQLDTASLKFVRTANDEATTTTNTTNTIPIGGAAETNPTERDIRCAKLTEAKFQVGDSELTNATLNNLIITVPEKSNFAVVDNSYVCATEKALPNEKVIATIASKYDPSVKAEKLFTAGNHYVTKKIAMVNEANAKVANNSIVLSEANQNRNLNFKYLNSDNSVSNAIVPADYIIVTFTPESEFFSATKVKEGSAETWQVSIAENQLENLKKQTIVSQQIIVDSTDSNFTAKIPLSFSKN